MERKSTILQTRLEVYKVKVYMFDLVAGHVELLVRHPEKEQTLREMI